MKIILSLVVVIVAIGMFYYNSKVSEQNGVVNTKSSNVSENTNNQDSASTNNLNIGSDSVQKKEVSSDTDITDELDDVIKPAYQVYSNAEEALAALKKAAVDYDDIVLEQFSSIGPECSWCTQLFGSLQEKLQSAETTTDEKSYYAEILAISGRPDNVAYLVDSIKNAKSSEDSDIFSEALEVVTGNNEVVDYLGKQLESSSEELKESLLAALTNHGSKQAIDLLYNETVKKNDPDGFYSLGIGLGEVIPEPESIPYLTELANKRDDYSHLAVKALLNSGTDGLKVVMDIVSSSSDAESNKKLLTDAIDHVPFEEDTENYLKEIVNTTKSEAVKEFAQSVLNDFQADLPNEE
jgi:hypothetical protein